MPHDSADSRTRRVSAAYDARAEEYVELFGSIHQLASQDRATIEAWRDGTSGRLLDAGCGPGHWTDLMAADGEREVLGIDASAAFLASARARFPRCDVVRGDLAAMPLASGSLGGVLTWYSIIHTPPAEIPTLLGELRRVLAPGGSLLIGYFDGAAGEPFDHAVTTAWYWSASALGTLLGNAGLTIERAGTRQDPGARRKHGELVARAGSQAVVVKTPAPLSASQSAQETL